MAFRQPQQRPPTVRHASISQTPPALAPEIATQRTTRKRQVEEEAQEWVLFSPTVDDQDQDHLSGTSRTSQTPRTANLSRFSDLESLETGLRTDQYAVDEATCQGSDIDDDEADLDSLDDGLHAFHPPPSPRLDHSGGTVLPMHDGLGTFPSTQGHGTSQGMQEHLWQFERYNPHRRRPQRRRSSVQKRIDALEEEEELHSLDKHEERRLRVEKWRLEQSRAVLEEIERETRRRQRRLSLASTKASVHPRPNPSLQDTRPVTNAEASADEREPAESFWQRITRRLINDLMGLDETTLSVIFGEDLPPDLDSTPTQSSPLATATSASVAVQSEMTWEQRLLDRIARELGFLADRLAEHEGAFNTYNDLATSPDGKDIPIPARNHIPNPSVQTLPTLPLDQASTSDSLFSPTFPRAKAINLPPADTSLWGIEEEPPLNTNSIPATASGVAHQDKEYWERDLDVGVIFRYLRNRFSSSRTSTKKGDHAPRNISSDATSGPLPNAWASGPNASALGTSPESFRRADMIRRNHPLVSHAASVTATQRRESMLLRRQHQFLSHRRAGSSSCASQSTKRTRSGGSRRYWDFPTAGGSATGGSAVSVTSGGYEGMMGSWGEV